MSHTASWNIKGFNMPHKQKEVREYVRKYELQMVYLLNTRVQENKMVIVVKNCFPGQTIKHNYHSSVMGKIQVCWAPSIGSISYVYKDNQIISMEIEKVSGGKYLIIVVYASTDTQQRINLYNYLINMAYNVCIPWMVLGYFNSILN